MLFSMQKPEVSLKPWTLSFLYHEMLGGQKFWMTAMPLVGDLEHGGGLDGPNVPNALTLSGFQQAFPSTEVMVAVWTDLDTSGQYLSIRRRNRVS